MQEAPRIEFSEAFGMYIPLGKQKVLTCLAIQAGRSDL
jgi:hypothetical protein